MTWLDWTVILLYSLAMLGVGWYYSLRSKTTEDYLLGGRSMRPLGLGLSLFATMVSAISFLSFPGEIIRYGPTLILGTAASYPLVFLLIGWLMIPAIMKMRITSAYELLEVRLGLSVRLLGAVFFLLLRLMWMAVVIHATTDKVLGPLMGIPANMTVWLGALLAAITIIYTTMGGLRAVVFTDVVQSIILFTGAILTLVIITYWSDGINGWWSNEWPSHWPAIQWGYSTKARVSFTGALLATLIWYVCTTGSDQMAVQRYLATRNVILARRMLAYSLFTTLTATVLLSVVGLALLRFFQQHSDLLAGASFTGPGADTLFPRFIALGLPSGMSGLVIAGLLAASMSSLSSGINAACSVILTDFIDRFSNIAVQETERVRLAKLISVCVGVVVVLLSCWAGMVQGNLLTLAYKICNLFTAPLFGLFFMAMFVPWSTSLGTIIGAVCGLAVVVLINFWEDMTQTKGISFLWAMPLGLIAQVLVGMVVSVLTLNRPLSPDSNSIYNI